MDTTVHIALGALPGPVAALVHLTEVCVHVLPAFLGRSVSTG
ncbi:hypothetical protein [Streptomyces sp. NPDC101165]